MASRRTSSSRKFVGSRKAIIAARGVSPHQTAPSKKVTPSVVTSAPRRASKPLRIGWRPPFLATAALVGAALIWFWQGPRFASPPAPPRSLNARSLSALPRDPIRPLFPTPRDETDDQAASQTGAIAARSRPEMVRLAGGVFWMGSDDGADGEQPRHEVRLDPFWLDIHEVTNRQFSQFAKATGYVTAAERDRSALVFDLATKRWRTEANANWRRPDGIKPFLPEAPVAQVTWDDALAYAHWAGKRLPTEAEWEYAARGGLDDCDYAWGRQLSPQGRYPANYWQGWFPDDDLGLDGFSSLAPVRSFPASRYNLFDLIGNVWEWCADWHAADYYEVSARDNPSGPARGARRVLRGGSWLSAENSDRGLRVYGREGLAPTSRRQDVGFRCARDDVGGHP